MAKQNDFRQWARANEDSIRSIRACAWDIHEGVNQHYDGDKPYGFHLDMVASALTSYGYEVCTGPQDILPLYFGAFFHDTIEDARMTYNDVRKTARRFMNDDQASVAAEIVYALTNEKGRNRHERADERYYSGIRSTPFAPFMKLCDRLANITYSVQGTNDSNNHMKLVYREELPGFLNSLANNENVDCRFILPEDMILEIKKLIL